MNAQQSSRPLITPAMREQATKQPNTWLYVVDPIFTDPSAEVPPWGFVGGYRVDERGEITDDYSPNPHYRPSPVALRMPAPANDTERALQLAITGYTQGSTLLSALLDSELILFAQPGFADVPGSGLFMMDHESGRKQLQAFTSETYLPNGWTSWQRMTGRQLLASLNGVDLQLNPNSPTKARIPGEDLIRAAGGTPTPPPPPVATGGSGTNSGPAGPGGPAPTEAATARADGGSPEASGTDVPAAQPINSSAAPAPLGNATPAAPGNAGAGAEPGVDQRFLGSILGSAVGEALGAPVEFYPVDQIRTRFGQQGVVDYDRSSEQPGRIGDGSQLTMFTLEGLIRGHRAVRAGVSSSPLPAVHHAYQRWLHTQGISWQQAAGLFATKHAKPDGWLVEEPGLFHSRSPGSTCIAALRSFAAGNPPGSLTHRVNDSQGCEGLVRAAPVALWSKDASEVFEVAAATAALTHGHPNAYLSAGTFAVIVHGLLQTESLAGAVQNATAVLARYPGHEEQSRALEAAIELAERGQPTPEQIKDQLGGGWVAAEALAIAVCAALSSRTLTEALLAAVNHSGDSASTAAICGGIAGAHYGVETIPPRWLTDLELGGTIETLAREALREFGPQPPDTAEWDTRYPCQHETFGKRDGQREPADSATTTQSAGTEDVARAESDAVHDRGRVPDSVPRGDSEPPTTGSDAGNASSSPEVEVPSSPQRSDADAAMDEHGRKVLGCLLGGAVGDALGYAIEFDSISTVREKYGAEGLTDLVDAHRPSGSISDETQMTLFTLEGLIRASIRRRLFGETEPATQVQHAYQRWLHTQGFDWKDAGGTLTSGPPDGWLIQQKGLFARRAPGATSIQSLHSVANGGDPGSFAHRINDSKGCGGVMRSAPAALWSADRSEVFSVGAITAVLTHGHPNGFLPAGALAVIVQELLRGTDLRDCVHGALDELSSWDGHEETSTGLRRAVELAEQGTPTPEELQDVLGEGWVGEEALAIAVCAALAEPDSFAAAVQLAANHSGDSDSTAAICGNIVGTRLGSAEIPGEWREKLELREVIEELVRDAIREFGPNPPEHAEWLRRYPIGGPPEPERDSPDDERAESEAPAVVPDSVPAATAAPPDEPAVVDEPDRQDSADPSAQDGFEANYAERNGHAEFAAPPPATTANLPEQPRVDPEPATAESAVDSSVSESAANDAEASGLDEHERAIVAAWRTLRSGGTPNAHALDGLRELVRDTLPADDAAELLRATGQDAAGSPAVAARASGGVLGSALGDSLGAGVLFHAWRDIEREHGPAGIASPASFAGRRGAITSNTQVSLFVLETLLDPSTNGTPRLPAAVRNALRRWMYTQQAWPAGGAEPAGRLAAAPELFAQRLPDQTTMVTLAEWAHSEHLPTMDTPPNRQTGCGALARSAAIGLLPFAPEQHFDAGTRTAVLTHGHPDAYLPAGALSTLVGATLREHPLDQAVELVLSQLARWEGHHTTSRALEAAVELANHGRPTPQDLAGLGSGWDAPQALATGVAATLGCPESFTAALRTAANHSGNSATTAVVCGWLAGTAHGRDALPAEWLAGLELGGVIDGIATDWGARVARPVPQ